MWITGHFLLENGSESQKIDENTGFFCRIRRLNTALTLGYYYGGVILVDIEL